MGHNQNARASIGNEGIGTIVVAGQPLSFGTTLTTENVAEIGQCVSRECVAWE